MIISIYKQTRRRALSAILCLLLGWLSVPLSLAFTPADVCSMECCVKEGYCCCATRHEYVEGQIPTLEDAWSTPAAFSSCPEKCCPAGMASQTAYRTPESPRFRRDGETASAPPIKKATASLPEPFVTGQSAPRAPPTPLL